MNRLTLIIITVVAALVLGFGGRYLLLGDAQQPARPVAGKALVGGPFTLTDQNGQAVSEKTYAGRHTLVYFGYTYCPDVCPLGLQVIGEALDIYGEKGGDTSKVVPLFITVDPERDTVEVMKGYVENFHPAMQGLTGSVDQITQVAKAYRVYYAKVKDEDSSADYLMDHTAITYLMGPDGGYVGHFGHTVTPEKMAEKLAETLN